MFTGIIERIGKLSARNFNSDGSGKIEIVCKKWDSELIRGESIAVAGACLSLENFSQDKNTVTMSFSALKETFDKTNLGLKPVGSEVNLERALIANSRLGGHFVTGHVDTVSKVSEMKKKGRDWRLEVECDRELSLQIVQKGSIAIEGVSLTIAEVFDDKFAVYLIPLTLEKTSLKSLKPYSMVNIETDLIGKYVVRQIASYQKKKVDMNFLEDAGFLV